MKDNKEKLSVRLEEIKSLVKIIRRDQQVLNENRNMLALKIFDWVTMATASETNGNSRHAKRLLASTLKMQWGTIHKYYCIGAYLDDKRLSHTDVQFGAVHMATLYTTLPKATSLAMHAAIRKGARQNAIMRILKVDRHKAPAAEPETRAALKSRLEQLQEAAQRIYKKDCVVTISCAEDWKPILQVGDAALAKV